MDRPSYRPASRVFNVFVQPCMSPRPFPRDVSTFSAGGEPSLPVIPGSIIPLGIVH